MVTINCFSQILFTYITLIINKCTIPSPYGTAHPSSGLSTVLCAVASSTLKGTGTQQEAQTTTASAIPTSRRPEQQAPHQTMSSSLTQAPPKELREQEANEELSAWKRETRFYLLKEVNSSIDYAAQELERIDFIWGRIRSDRGAASPTIKADIRVEGHLVVFTKVELKLTKAQRNAPITSTLQQYCVLNQILEFHGIMQSQVGRLAALKEFMHVQRNDLLNDQPSNDDVELYVEIVQRTFQSLGRICQELRNAANVLRLPSRRRFPYCSHVDHSFKPALPSEVIVDFSIHRGELLVEAFSLTPTQKAITNIPEGCASRKEFIGCVCAFRGQKVEIVEYARVSVPIPQLEEMLVHLDEQIAWLVHVRDNVKALLDCQDLYYDYY
ncbi:hypothetical protein P3T76_009167 [Phytophthora citrophthora]|uniref:Uncharacterized protein n=1 Tax=Phytophthora citrophthora TaxID=4793 RepID=A0AAD9LJM0_9STRA|nr:hypothetical protein P3T76_009167 [Phytophthora citrophthora]